MKKWLLIFVIFVIVILWQSIHTYNTALDYKSQAYEIAISVAKEHESLVEIKEVTTYNGNASYTIVYGVTSDQNERIICVPNSDDKEIISIDPKEGISKEKAIDILKANRNPLEIKDATIGIEQDVPIWEITYLDHQGRYSYYYITFKDGKFIKRYSL
jgi:uncharacterized protein YpmB